MYVTKAGYRTSSRYIYAYNNMEKYDLEGEAYEQESMTDYSNIKIYESDECTIPVLKKFESKGKPSIFSFAIGYKEEEYVFFVPEGTVIREQ